MQEDNKKPNFDFIMSQPGAQLEKPKRSKKPLMVIGGAVMFLFILTAVALLTVKKSTNVQQAGTPQASSLFLAVSNSSADDAFNLFETQASLDKDWFTENFLKPYNERFDMKSCVQQADKYKTTDTDVVLTYKCPFKDKSQGEYVTLVISVSKQTSKISKLEMVTTAS